MVVPEHRPHIGIDPESLSDELDRHDILHGMIVLQGTKKRDFISLDRLDPADLIATDIIRADQDFHLQDGIARHS